MSADAVHSTGNVQYTGVGVALGAGVGLTIGVIAGDGVAIALGLAIGGALGATIGGAADAIRSRRNWAPARPARPTASDTAAGSP